MQDIELFELIKNDDAEALKQLMRSYYQDLVYYVYSIIKNQEAAEELTQDVFISIWENRFKIEIRTSVKNYLYTAARNKSLSYLKSKYAQKAKEIYWF
ncbi:sigma-70 family RNA polymerase sigma factor [Bacteroidota bacterium]